MKVKPPTFGQRKFDISSTYRYNRAADERADPDWVNTSIKPFKHTSPRKKALTLGRRKEKFRQRNWGSNPGPLVLRTSALTTELSCHIPFLRPNVSAFFLRLVCWNGLIDVFTHSGLGLSCVIICKSVHRITSYGVGRCWL